mgnify:CR=1 FL=1
MSFGTNDSKTIAEATYTVLIEQVKAQSMIAGYQPNRSQIFEYAAPPLKESTPNLKHSLIIGLILGLFFGTINEKSKTYSVSRKAK